MSALRHNTIRMKKSTTLLGTLVALLLLSVSTLSAQSEGEIIITQEKVNEDGTVTVIKKRMPLGEEADLYLEEVREMGGSINIEIREPGDEMEGDTELGDDDRVFFFRRAGERMEEMEIEIEENMERLGEQLEQLEIRMERNFEDFEGFNFQWESRTRCEKATKAFLGVYTSGTPDGRGVTVESLVEDGPAEKADLQKEDIVMSLDGEPTNGTRGLRHVLTQLEPGSTVTAVIVRDGNTLSVPVQLGEKTYNREVWVNDERTPCKVFIGVYVGGTTEEGEGVKVNGIIGNTPASESNIRPGDIILEMDGVPVSGNSALLQQRDKHSPGDEFTLLILRDGTTATINARFKACEEADAPVEEESELELPQLPLAPDGSDGQGNLMLERYRAFPNPTFGQLRVQFEAEAVATNLQITDAVGRVVYEAVLDQFDGTFDEQLFLQGAAPGLLTLTIRQGDRMVTKQLVLVARA